MSADLEDADQGRVRLELAGAWCMALSEGELPASEQVRFEAWLEADPANRAAFEDTVGVWGAVAEVGLSPRVLNLRREALADLERRRRGARASRGWLAGQGGRIAALLLVGLLVLGGGGAWLGLRPKVLETDAGERRVARLEDGSRVSLDASTRVRVRYDRGHRTLWLDHGRAKFDVAHDPARPFTVAAADKMVRATGTQFSVELLNGQVRVVLYEGHVLVRARQGDRGLGPPIRLPAARAAADADTELAPGRELVAPIAASVAQVVAADPARSLAWEAGQLVFVDEPLASAVERVNRYTTAKLAVGDEAAGRVRVDAVFSAGDPEAFVEGVTGMLPVRAVGTDKGVVLVSLDAKKRSASE